MFRTLLSFLLLPGFLFSLSAQIVRLDPSNAGPDDAVTLYFNAAEGNGELVGADKVYIHHGIVTDSPDSQEWTNVIGNWGQDDGVGEMTKVEGTDDEWKIELTPSIREYFGVSATENIYRISAVFRSADGGLKGSIAPGNYGWGEVASNGDYFINLSVENYLIIKEPVGDFTYLQDGESRSIVAETSGQASSLSIFLDQGDGYEEKVSASNVSEISYEYNPSKTVDLNIKVTATVDGADLVEEEVHRIYLVDESPVAELPHGVQKGINYHDNDPTKVTLVLEAPGKDFVYVTGEFNDWNLADTDYQMNKTADGELFWLEINGLEAGTEYIFQYQINGETTIGDPYAEKIADPWNDKFIESSVYPNLKSYTREQFGPASYLQTSQQPYQWAASEQTYQRPEIEHLVIYELLVRDFIGSHSYPDLIDTLSYLKNLGINAIELMPVSEFEGNESWGYNPMYYFAPDKYYGTKDQLKHFIEAAHEMGMAVILDMVLNHAYGLNPMVRMYWDQSANQIAEDNPWFNVDYVGPYEWGYDFDHTSQYTRDFIDSVNTYWLREYHFDGYRFDFTKGFTQNDAQFDGFNQERIDILKRMANVIWEEDPNAYVMLEHWGGTSEEEELADYGMVMWRNRVHSFYDAITGATDGSFSDLDDITHITFVGSHDEERVAHLAVKNGISDSEGSYTIRNKAIMAERAKMIAAFNLLNPGPKMIWQFDELGYDVSIDFNGRVGNKPLPWGPDGLGYYEDPVRKFIYDAYAGILDVRSTLTPEKLASATTNHVLGGRARRLVYNTDDIDVVLIGNLDVEELEMSPAFPSTGEWFDYFSGESIDIANTDEMMVLAAGEWHIYTSQKISDGKPGVVKVAQNPVSVAPFPFRKDDEIIITFDASKASNDGTAGLVNASKVYMHAGIIIEGDAERNLVNVIGNLVDDGVGQMSFQDGKWQITLVPEDYFGLEEDEDIRSIAMYFRNEDNTLVGKGFRDELVFVDVQSSTAIVSILPANFTATDEITITFNAGAGNGELANANKVYLHGSVDISNTETPWLTGWNHVVGNWGADDGIGLMTKSEDNPLLWELTLVPSDYFEIYSSSFPKWISAVFRSADGGIKATAQPGTFENGIIHTNFDIFVENKGQYILSTEEPLRYRVYPNPTSDRVTIDRMTIESVQVRVIDFSGRVHHESLQSGKQLEVNLRNLESGLYLIQLSSGADVDLFRVIKN